MENVFVDFANVFSYCSVLVSVGQVVEGEVVTGLSNGSHGVELHIAATALPANQDITAGKQIHTFLSVCFKCLYSTLNMSCH